MGSKLTVQGSLASPTAGAVVVQKLGLAPGLYTITVTARFAAGAPVVADADNFELLVDDVSVGLIPGIPASASLPGSEIVFREEVITGSLKVRAKVAGTAGVTYDVILSYQKDS